MNDYEIAAQEKLVDKLKEWTSPDAVLKDLALANKFWVDIQLMDIPEFNTQSIQIAAEALRKIGIPLPWPKIEDADNTQVMLITDALQYLAAFEEAIVDKVIRTRVELALSLLFIPEKFVLFGVNFVNRFLDWLFERGTSGSAYWRALMEALGSTIFLLMIAPAAATIKGMFGEVMMPIWEKIPEAVLFQSTGPRVRKRARTRIAQQVRPRP